MLDDRKQRNKYMKTETGRDSYNIVIELEEEKEEEEVEEEEEEKKTTSRRLQWWQWWWS